MMLTTTERRVIAAFAAFACLAGLPSAAGRTGAAALAGAASPRAAVGQQVPRLTLTDDGADLDAALSAKSAPRDVPVRLAGLSLPDADPAKARLLLLVDVAEAGLQGPGLASVSYVVENERGQSQARALRRKELPRGPDGSLAFSEAIALPAGTYRVKVAAMRNGRIGTAQGTFSLKVQAAGSLRVGDLVVGEAAGEDLRSSMSFDHRIAGDRLVASLTVAGVAPPDLTMTVEVARDAGSPAMLSAPATTPEGGDPVRVAQAQLDVRALPQGEYLARAIVAAGGREVCRVSAPFTRERAASAAAASAPSPKARGNRAPAPTPGAGFNPDDVLDPSVLRPLLDDLSMRAADRAKGAIDQAKAGRFAEAAKTAAASKDPNDPVPPFLQGLSLFSQKQLQAASESFRETLRAAPDYFAGAFYIGACYAAGGRDPQAVNAWQTSLVGMDQYPIVYRLLGDALTRMGQPDKAVEALDEALGKWPANTAIRLRLAKAALDARRYDRVFDAADTAPADRPDADLLFVGMQAVFEQAGAKPGAPAADVLSRIKRYRDAYTTAGGTRQALVDEWVSSLEKKK
jgi:tetratricopeptide (TPR) repeat protein